MLFKNFACRRFCGSRIRWPCSMWWLMAEGWKMFFEKPHAYRVCAVRAKLLNFYLSSFILHLSLFLKTARFQKNTPWLLPEFSRKFNRQSTTFRKNSMTISKNLMSIYKFSYKTHWQISEMHGMRPYMSIVRLPALFCVFVYVISSSLMWNALFQIVRLFCAKLHIKKRPKVFIPSASVS